MLEGARHIARRALTSYASCYRRRAAQGVPPRCGQVYEAGWVQKPGWTLRTPYGRPAADTEPAIHVTFQEAQAYCRWRGKRLPTDAEWMEAAYTERRPSPTEPSETGVTYPYPTGPTPPGSLGSIEPLR